MLSLIQLPLSVAVLAFALAPAVESTVTSQRWIPRKGKMDTMVVDLGGNRFSPSGSQCRLQDLSNEPILSLNDAQANLTYLTAALSFAIQPTDTQADSFDPLQLFSASSIYLSYLQTSMRSRAEQSTILSSDLNPLVPFQLPEPSCGQDMMIVLLVAEQPHPLLAEDCYVNQFAEMEEDNSKRRDYKMGGFWESAALGDVQAATWVVVKNDNAECRNACPNGGQNGGGSTAGREGPQFVTVSTDSGDTTTTTTTTISASSSGVGNSTQAGVGGGEAVQATTITTEVNGTPTTITSTIPDLSTGINGGEAAQSTTITTVKDGKSTTITTTTLASSIGVGGESGAFVGGQQGGDAGITTTITTEVNGTPTCITTTVPAKSGGSTSSSGGNGGTGANGENDKNKTSSESNTAITTTITSTGTITTISGSSTIATAIATTFVSTVTGPAPARNSSGAATGSVSVSDSGPCDCERGEGSNNENKGRNGTSKSESESYYTTIKITTKTTTNDKGSKVEQVATTTETSAIIDLQAPVPQSAVSGGPNPAEPSTSSSSPKYNNSPNTIITTNSPGAGLNAGPTAGVAGKPQQAIQTAGAVAAEPAVVAAVLMGSLGGFYFAFM